MANYSGVVRKIFTNQFGGNKLYSFTLDSDKSYFNLGRKAPNFSEGQTVQFDAVQGKRQGNNDVQGDVVITNETPVKSEDYSMAGGARRSSEVLTKDKYWENREANDVKVQKVIQIQAARNAAIALYQALFSNLDATALKPEPAEFLNKWTDTFLKNNEDRLSV